MTIMGNTEFRLWDTNRKKFIEEFSMLFTKDGEVTYFERNSEKELTMLPTSHIRLIRCTGLVDENNKLLYTGDICKRTWVGYGKEDVAVIDWCKKSAQFMLHCKLGEFDLYSQLNDRYLTVEVIGNIYENPELLEQKQLKFETGKYYKHTTGKKMSILGVVNTTMYGNTLLAETDCNGFKCVGSSTDATVNWTEITREEWMKSFSTEELEQQVKKVLLDILEIEEDIINEASIYDDLGADSLDTVEILMGMERQFNIEISDEEAEKIKTVQDAINLVKKLKV